MLFEFSNTMFLVSGNIVALFVWIDGLMKPPFAIFFSLIAILFNYRNFYYYFLTFSILFSLIWCFSFSFIFFLRFTYSFIYSEFLPFKALTSNLYLLIGLSFIKFSWAFIPCFLEFLEIYYFFLSNPVPIFNIRYLIKFYLAFWSNCTFYWFKFFVFELVAL
jgi:hypothetical protein